MDVNELPAQPSVEHRENLAKDLMDAYSSGDSTALQRISESNQGSREEALESLQISSDYCVHRGSIIQMLIDAGAKIYETDVDFPTGNEAVDELLRRHGMKA